MLTRHQKYFRLIPFAALLTLAGCNDNGVNKVSNPSSPRAVLMATVEKAQERENLYTGVVTARTESDLGFRVSGKVIKRLVDPGDRVKRGDTLLILDIQDFELALRAAKTRVNAASARMAQVQEDERRYRRLSKTGAISRQIFDQSTTNLKVAEAELAAAASEASQVAHRRDYSTLTADADGVITEVLVERGHVVSEGQIVARLAHDGPREAVIHIPETQRNFAASPALAYAFDAPNIIINARLRELSATAEPATRTFRAHYILEGKPERFSLGSTISIRLQDAPASSLLRVPIGALYDPGTGPGVWLISEDNKVRFASVRVASLGQEFALLQTGVSRGQHIVALGAHLLHAGEHVRVLPTQGLALAQQQSSPHEL